MIIAGKKKKALIHFRSKFYTTVFNARHVIYMFRQFEKLLRSAITWVTSAVTHARIEVVAILTEGLWVRAFALTLRQVEHFRIFARDSLTALALWRGQTTLGLDDVCSAYGIPLAVAAAFRVAGTREGVEAVFLVADVLALLAFALRRALDTPPPVAAFYRETPLYDAKDKDALAQGFGALDVARRALAGTGQIFARSFVDRRVVDLVGDGMEHSFGSPVACEEDADGVSGTCRSVYRR